MVGMWISGMGWNWGHIPFIQSSSPVCPVVFGPGFFPVPPLSSPQNLCHIEASPSGDDISSPLLLQGRASPEEALMVPSVLSSGEKISSPGTDFLSRSYGLWG
jgi:hypothetical protein